MYVRSLLAVAVFELATLDYRDSDVIATLRGNVSMSEVKTSCNHSKKPLQTERQALRLLRTLEHEIS